LPLFWQQLLIYDNQEKALGAIAALLSFLAFSAESLQTPQQLVELSRKASDLSAVGPYQLDATVVLNPGTSKEVSTSVLVKAKGLEFHEVEFRDFGTFEQKCFPRKIIVRDQDKTFLEITNINISKAKADPDMFELPKDAIVLPTCDELTPARKIKDINPEIPFEELRRARSAIVYLYGFIATDGSVQNITVEYSPSKAFTESARNAFQQWRYKPATCGDKPVPTEIETHFLYFVR
jgi:hypothetical protein